MDVFLEANMFCQLPTEPLMTNDQYNLFVKLLKLKPSIFKSTGFEDVYNFVVDCYELLHKIDIVT